MKILGKIAKILYRKPFDTTTESKKLSTNKELRVLNFIFIMLAFLLVPLIWNIYQDQKVSPLVEIKASDWNTYFSEKIYDHCNLNGQNDQSCIAHPENPTLWNNGLKRLSKEYLKKVNVDNADFWIATVISEDMLNEARSHSANYLVLQQIEGSYDVWIDGSLVGQGSYQNNDYPMVFPIPMVRLLNEPLHLAIHIKKNIYTTNIESNDFETRKDGFYANTNFESVIRWQSASGQTGNLIFVALYLLLAILFFLTIRQNDQGPEYTSATALAGCLSLFHLMHVDAMYRFVSPELWYSLLAGILCAMMILNLKFAVSYSRSKLTIENILFYMLVTSFLFVSLFLKDAKLTGDLINYISKYGLPASYLAGAIILFIQFNYLAKDETEGYSLRQENLLFICTMYFLGAVIIFTQYQSVHDVSIEIPSGLWINIVFLFYLAIKTGKNISSQLDMFLKAPISSFHRRSNLPKRVDGTILMIDLKNSEGLFRQGAEKNRGGTIMSVILSNLWVFFKQEGLTILQGEGDSIIALWENGKNDSTEKILQTIISLEKFMHNLSENLVDNGVQLETSIYFRAAIIEGAVRPIWREIENDKIPAWIEAGEKNVFVDAARLLTIEKELVPDQNRSSLIVMSELADKYQEQTPHFTEKWDIHKMECVSKHGRTYNVSIFNPTESKAIARTG
jgi:hypothetical protein